MTKLNELPEEILFHILSYLAEPSAFQILRTCRTFHRILTHLLFHRITLDESLLFRLSDLPKSFHSNLHTYTRYLHLVLEGPARHSSSDALRRTSEDGISQLCSAVVAFGRWSSALGSNLSCLSKLLEGCVQLEEFVLHARSKALGGYITVTAPGFVVSTTLANLVRGLGATKGENLTILELDTADADSPSVRTRFSPSFGFGIGSGRPCEQHVCQVLVKAMVQLKSLKTVRFRRREICPGLFAFGKGGSDGKILLPNLETFVVSTRLAGPPEYVENALPWGVCSRPCLCACDCVDCEDVSTSSMDENEVPGSRDVDNWSRIGSASATTMHMHLIKAARSALPLMPAISTFKILGFVKPEIRQLEQKRDTFVADCLAEKGIWVTKNPETTTMHGWDDAQRSELGEGWVHVDTL